VISLRQPSLLSCLFHSTAHRFLSVRIVTRIVNPDPHKSHELLLFEPLPTDFLLPSFHQFTVTQQNLSSPLSLSPLSSLIVFEEYPFAFFPSICRSSGSAALSSFCEPESQASALPTLRVNLTIPPNSITTLTLPCQKKFLSRPYQPTDSSRGVDIPPAIVIFSSSHSSSFSSSFSSFPSSPSILVTEPWVITMPYPDGSMPFNVIIIVSTTVALLFGSLANVLIRKSSLESPQDRGG
jgi:hypothetical protein